MKMKAKLWVRGLLIALLACFFTVAMVACGKKPDPEVTAVTLTAKAEHTGYSGAEYTLDYTVTPADAAVTVSVKKGETDATENTDYTYDATTKVVTFKTAGTYTVTVSPATGTAKTSESVTVADHSVTSVTLAAATAYVNETVGVTVAVVPTGETYTVTAVDAANNDAAVDASKYTYDATAKTVKFTQAGSYKVKATLSNHASVSATSSTLTVKNPEVSGVTVTANADHTGYTGAEYTVAYTVAPADTAVTVSVKKGDAAATENTDYTYNTTTKVVTFKTAGTYTVTVTPAGGTAVNATAVTVADHTATSVTLAAATAYVNETVGVTVAVAPADEAYTVTVLDAGNNDAVVATSKYTYDATAKTVKFTEAGSYKVKATLTNHEGVAATSTAVTVKNPEVSGVTVTANADHTGYTGAEYTVAYTVAPTGTAVTVSVKKGDAAATENTDYTYNTTTKVVTFKTAGTYTVTVTPAGGTAVNATAVTVADHTATSVTLNKSIEMINTDVGVEVVVAPSDETYSISVLDADNEDAVVDSSKYTFNSGVIQFKEGGTYKVKATLSNHADKSATSSAITILATSAPIFTLTADKTSAEENENVIVSGQGSVSYPDGSTKKTATWAVEYSADGETYATAEAANYAFNEETGVFAGKVVGTYKLSYTVTCNNDHSTTNSVVVTVVPAELTLAVASSHNLTNGWLRVLANDTDTVVNYTVEGYAANYTVTYGGAGEASQEDGLNVKVHCGATPDTYEAKVIYTHNVVTTKTFTLTVKVCAVSSLENSPILGADPFGGTYNVVIPSTGLVLYYSATKADGTAIDNYAGVVYTIADDSELESANGGVAIEKVAGDGLPFILVKDFDAAGGNDAHGYVTVKMTITDGEATTVATKKFEVKPLGDGFSIANYIAAVTNNSCPGSNWDYVINNTGDHRQNGAVSKSGFIVNRGNGNWFRNGDPARVDVQESAEVRKNFAITFDLTPYGVNSESDGNVSLATFFAPVGGWNGNTQFGIYCETAKGDTVYHAGNWNGSYTKQWGTDPEFHLGQTYCIRLSHTISGDKVVVKAEWKFPGDTDYTAWTTMTVDKLDNGNELGSPIDRVQFVHERGCYAIENIVLTVENA